MTKYIVVMLTIGIVVFVGFSSLFLAIGRVDLMVRFVVFVVLTTAASCALLTATEYFGLTNICEYLDNAMHSESNSSTGEVEE